MRLLQHRTYDARVFMDGEEMVARGEVTDNKPPGTLVPGDTESVVMHNMVVELRVSFPDLTITGVSVLFNTYPNRDCPLIAAAYDGLIGLSIARGFTHRIRELLGGPRGCTHVGALLQALAPAVVQATWSAGGDFGAAAPGSNPDQARQAQNINTCHIYAADTERVAMIRRGERLDPPLPVQERLAVLGLDPDDWRMG